MVNKGSLDSYSQEPCDFSHGRFRKTTFWARFGDYLELVSAEIRNEDWSKFINMDIVVYGETADGEPIAVNLRNASTLQILESEYDKED